MARRAPRKKRSGNARRDSTTLARERERLTELGNAQRLIRLRGDDVRYAKIPGKSQGRWYVWTGERWRFDGFGEQLMGFALDVVHDIWTEHHREQDSHRKQELGRHALRSETAYGLRKMIELASTLPGVAISPETFDTDPWLLGVANGVLDLRTGKLRPARREDYITKQTPIVFDPKARCPTFLQFLDRIFARNRELITYVQRAVGYSLTAFTGEQVFFILFGDGENGKSEFMHALEALGGEYVTETPVATLMAQPGRPGIPNDVAALRGARVVTTSETERGHRLAEAKIKKLTGGDAVSARFLHQEFFSFKPTFKLWMMANYEPQITGRDHAIWRRVHEIPFGVQIPAAERIGDYFEVKLRPELPGILNWAVAGCREWQRSGLRPPAEVLKAVEGYKARTDTLTPWIEEECACAPHFEGSTSPMYEAYRKYCRRNGVPPLDRTNFKNELEKLGYERKHKSSGNVYVGIDLLTNVVRGRGSTITLLT